MKRLALVLLLLTGCEERTVHCDVHGLRLPRNNTYQERMDAAWANVELQEKRYRYVSGERWIDQSQLVKAEGCP